MFKNICAVLVAASATVPTTALAWGPDGHRLVAEFAEARLTTVAQAEVKRLLAQEPGATLVSVATWADETRSVSTVAWHWVNFARDAGCNYAPERNCIEGNCVVGAIERQTTLLASRGASDAQRLDALKYVVHFVGDIHQPLHGGFADDRGGNGYQLQAFGAGTNMHQVWDNHMIRDWPGGLPALRVAMTAQPQPEVQGTAVTWVEESCRITSTPGFYPEGQSLGPEYSTRWSANVVRRLSSASVRLAALLNVALAAP